MEKLTLQEEEAMLAIWLIGGGFIKDILEQMTDPKPPYTTLASTVKNLERKGFLTSEKFANSFMYKPVINAEQYRKSFVSGFVSNYFENSYKEVVNFFVAEKKLSAKELKEIIDLIERDSK